MARDPHPQRPYVRRGGELTDDWGDFDDLDDFAELDDLAPSRTRRPASARRTSAVRTSGSARATKTAAYRRVSSKHPRQSWTTVPVTPRERVVRLRWGVVALVGLLSLQTMRVQLRPEVQARRQLEQRLGWQSIPGQRGSILTRDGVALVTSSDRIRVIANQAQIEDPAATAKALAPLLEGDAKELEAKLTPKTDSKGKPQPDGYVELTRSGVAPTLEAGLKAAVAEQFDRSSKADGVDPEFGKRRWERARAAGINLTLEGISLEIVSEGSYPANDLARPIVGELGPPLDKEADPRVQVGRSGLALQFETDLRGTPGRRRVERDAQHRSVMVNGVHEVDPARPGKNVVTSLDSALQVVTERYLKAAVVEEKATGAMAAVMDIKTGEILAMADMATDAAGQPVVSPLNRLLTMQYEPGSVLKTIAVSGALNEGLVTPQTVFHVDDRLRLAADREPFEDDHPHPPLDMSVETIVAQSSNVGTIRVAQRLGRARLIDYYRAFGFGALSGLDYPAEVGGSLPSPDTWSASTIGATAIGYEVAVTPLQILSAYATVAAGGEYHQPVLVRQIVDADGKVSKDFTSKGRRVLSEKTAAQMSEILTKVTEIGTGDEATIAGYKVAGKTGTARKLVDGEYVKGKNWATFVGFAPADAPRMAVIVVMDEPLEGYAALTAAPVFRQIATYALGRLGEAPADGDTSKGSR